MAPGKNVTRGGTNVCIGSSGTPHFTARKTIVETRAAATTGSCRVKTALRWLSTFTTPTIAPRTTAATRSVDVDRNTIASPTVRIV